MGSGVAEKGTEAQDHIHEDQDVTDISNQGGNRQRRQTDDSITLHSIHSATESHHVAQQDAEAALYRIRTPKQLLVKVPRKERRGWFAAFALIPEVTNPYDYKDSTKWFITFIVSVAGACAPVGSGIIFPTLEQVTRDLNSTPVVTNLTVALYMLSMAIFPLWWSAFSEASGRRSVYIASFALFVLWAVCCAISTSIEMLIVVRMLAGGAAASVQAVGVGTIADVWESHERGRAMGIFYLGPLCGPLFAPILGGIVGERWNWRATQWVLVIYGGKSSTSSVLAHTNGCQP
jgi:multidrug resistance protein